MYRAIFRLSSKSRNGLMGGINIQGNRVIELSQAIEPNIPIPVGFPGPKIEVDLSQARGDVAHVDIVTLSVHSATHCDAPYHFFSQLHTIDQLPADCLIGPAVVVNLTGKTGSMSIDATDLQT